MRNKKGDIPITVLVIGVFAICVFAIISFHIADNDVKDSISSVSAVEQSALAVEKISFYENLEIDSERIDELLDVQSDSQGRYILIEQGSVSVRYNLRN